MSYLAKLAPFLLICLIGSSESRNEDIREFLNGPDIHQALTLLEPTSLLQSRETIRSLAGNGAREITACMADLNTLQLALATNDMWAMKMVDASSKIPAGILQGNLVDLGMYDECIDIRNETVKIQAQHCQYKIEFSVNGTAVLPQNPSLSICLPLNCTVDDISTILNNTINSAVVQFNFTVKIPSVTCAPVDHKVWDTEFIICFAILMVYVAFLSVCTLCEIIYERCDDCHKSKLLASLTQFSFKRNAAAIFNMEVKPGTLPMLHGLRFISMLWIVLGHAYVNSMNTPTVNLAEILEWVQSNKSLYIFSAPFAVDTFFTISGFLMTYLFLKQMSKEKKFNIFMYYLHRFLRLTPAVIALIVFTIVFVPKIGSGPQYDASMEVFAEGCRKKWWPTILYIGNFMYKDTLCLDHLWYLNVDMQLYWVSPFILYPLYRKPKLGLIVLCSFFLASIVVPALLVSIYEYRTASFMLDMLNQKSLMDMFREIYMMAYNRAGPWLVGIYFGYELSTNKRTPKKFTVFIGWVLSAVAFAACIYGTWYFKEPGYEYKAVAEALFTAFSRPIWGFGVCWVIYACFHNMAGPITSFLSCSAYLPFSRLSYAIYLVHMVVQTMQGAALRTPKYFSDYYVWYYYISDFVISVVVAIIFSLLFESPILALEKMIFNRKKTSPTESKKDLTINSSTEDVNELKSKSKY